MNCMYVLGDPIEITKVYVTSAYKGIYTITQRPYSQTEFKSSTPSHMNSVFFVKNEFRIKNNHVISKREKYCKLESDQFKFTYD